ncbi:MAG: hypothetical protein OEN56_05045, partial [Gemmatimonadota bacterium]|nr:hypothetical protein [Gemmatimonadota bacterium]
KEARDARHLDQVALERVQDLLPLKRQLERIDALRRAGGPRSDLVELPEDLVGYRDDLETRLGILRRDIAAIDADLIEPDAAVARFDEASAHLIEHRDAIAAFATRSAGGADDRVRLTDVRVRREESELEIAAAADNLLTAPPTESVLDAVEAVSVELLRDRVARLDRSSRGRAPEATAAVESGGSTARGRAVALVAAGAALLAWGLLGGPVVAAAAGAACLGVGVTLALLRPDRSITPPASRGPTLDPIPELRREIEQMVSGLPVRSEYLDPPATPLPTAIERLQKAIAEARAFARTEQGLAARIAALDDEALRLRALLGRGSEQDSAELALTLDREVREAERIRDAAEVAERERARVLRARATGVADLTEVEDRIAAIEGRIWQLAAGAAGGRPIDVLHKRLEAHARADRIEEELQNAHPDLTDRVEQIRSAEAHGLAWTIDDEELAERKRRLEELGETIEKLIGRGEALERDIAHFRDRETVDTVDSEIESLREEEARLVKERDRKWLLAKLIREADRRFREEHQPDLLRRASAYLERLTGGRYDRLLVDEESDGDLFQLLGPQLPAPVALARPISTGTLEQAYLSLRLAIVDHLDPSEDRLPLFVDEAFVNWDDDRRGRGLEALSEVSRTRQVFAFTCHPEMADELRRRGACVIRLWP